MGNIACTSEKNGRIVSDVPQEDKIEFEILLKRRQLNNSEVVRAFVKSLIQNPEKYFAELKPFLPEKN